MLFFKKRKYYKIIKEAEDLHSEGKLEASRDKYLQAFEDIINIRDYINLACIYVDLKEYDKAIQIFLDIISSDKYKNEELADVYFGLAVCYDCQNQKDKAKDCYTKAIDYGCMAPECYYFLGCLYDDLELEEESEESKLALKYYHKAIEIYPKYLFAYVNLGNIYARFNKNDKALEYFLKAKELDVDHSANSDYNLGVIYNTIGDTDKAEYYYLEELKTENPYVSTYYNLGILYKDKKDYDKSLQYYLKSIEIDKEDFNAWYNLACLYALMNDYDNAFSCLTYIKYNKPKFLETSKNDDELIELRKDKRYEELFK